MTVPTIDKSTVSPGHPDGIPCPDYCDPRLCGNQVVGWHRSEGFRLDFPGTGPISVWVGRNDNPDEEEIGEPYISLDLDTRIVWADTETWTPPRDRNHLMLRRDLDRDEALVLGMLLQNRAESLSIEWDGRTDPTETMPENGNAVKITPVRAARGGAHLLQVGFPTKDFWTPDRVALPAAEGSLFVLLTVEDTKAIADALIAANRAIWDSYAPEQRALESHLQRERHRIRCEELCAAR